VLALAEFDRCGFSDAHVGPGDAAQHRSAGAINVARNLRRQGAGVARHQRQEPEPASPEGETAGIAGKGVTPCGRIDPRRYGQRHRNAVAVYDNPFTGHNGYGGTTSGKYGDQIFVVLNPQKCRNPAFCLLPTELEKAISQLLRSPCQGKVESSACEQSRTFRF
jgi:hypothetical protein